MAITASVACCVTKVTWLRGLEDLQMASAIDQNNASYNKAVRDVQQQMSH